MDIITYLHELFNEHLCNKYIHFLRWQGKKLQCPGCLKYNIAPWGNHHRRPGIKRHMCKDCHHTFNDLTNTPITWVQAIFEAIGVCCILDVHLLQ